MADEAQKTNNLILPEKLPEIKSISQNDTWGEKSTNKIEIGQEMQQAGIGFRSPVISNRINGILNVLSENQRWGQNTNELYKNETLYQEGSICNALINYGGSNWDTASFMCIKNDKPYGTKGIPPLNAVQGKIGNIPYFANGGVNTQYWLRLDYREQLFRQEIEQQMNRINQRIEQFKQEQEELIKVLRQDNIKLIDTGDFQILTIQPNASIKIDSASIPPGGQLYLNYEAPGIDLSRSEVQDAINSVKRGNIILKTTVYQFGPNGINYSLSIIKGLVIFKKGDDRFKGSYWYGNIMARGITTSTSFSECLYKKLNNKIETGAFFNGFQKVESSTEF